MVLTLLLMIIVMELLWAKRPCMVKNYNQGGQRNIPGYNDEPVAESNLYRDT